ncbi:MAG: VCBS repeat-containing protein [Planctomycetota bacterium]
MKVSRPILTVAASAALAATANAQNIDWASFDREDSRLVATNGLGLGDDEEKDYAWGDFDRDGWIDLIVVRKQPFTTTGRRRNVLFMNLNGTLTDQTAQFASASTTVGDEGFLTSTNDRDVAVGDFDGDGWLDFVTATTFSPGQSKVISHPRVYMNLGENGGVWQGFMFDEARIPDWGTYPNMCGVAVGDVTGDGAPDIYFSHYEQQAQVDLNDRLLINDGNGFFTDESSARMSAAMRGSSFGTSAVIADMNGDGTQDVISVSGSGQTGGLTRQSIAYNNENNEGFFNVLQTPYTGAPYHVAVGDLNADGRNDMIISDDADDRYMINEGNDVFGRVQWSAPFTYGGFDDGFGSNNLIIDLNGDDYAEAVICDVDVDLSGCGRRMHIYHNRGMVGSQVQLREERQGSNYGASGLPRLIGTHDVAIFDLDNDGDRDMVVGQCGGTRVYLNQRDQLGVDYCLDGNPNSSGAVGDLRAIGSPLAADNDVTLFASDLPNNTFGFFLASRERGLIANPGGSAGNLCLGANIGRYVGPGQIQNSGTIGEIQLGIDLDAIPQATGPVTALPGETFHFQAWYRDSVLGQATSNFTDAVALTLR